MSAVRFFFFGLRHLGGLHALQVMMTRRLRSRRGSWGAWSKDNSTFECIFCGASIPHVLWSSTTLMVDLVWSDVSSAGAHGMSSRNSVSVDDETLIHSHSVSSEIDYLHPLPRHSGVDTCLAETPRANTEISLVPEIPIFTSALTVGQPNSITAGSCTPGSFGIPAHVPV
jgi:hypothetical protein